MPCLSNKIRLFKIFILIFLGIIFAFIFPISARAASENIILKQSQLLEIAARNLSNNEKNDPEDSDKIIISEIMPKPKEGVDFEYIEIFNQGSKAVDLQNWSLEDNSGRTNRFVVSDHLLIEAGEYRIFYHSETKIALNDDTDGLKLWDPGGQLRFVTENYVSARQGESFCYIDNQWVWSLPTPSKKNAIISPDNSTDSTNSSLQAIAEAKEKENEVQVTIEGRVTAIPGQLSDQYFYIEDETAGIQIYSHNKLFPQLVSGDRIKVTGELSEVAGERRIKIGTPEDIEVIAHADAVLPQKLKLSELQTDLVGRYVKVRAKVTKSEGDTFFVQDESGNITKIMIRKTTGIKKPRLKKDIIIEVSGILSQYKNEYRILPFTQDDVKIITSGYLPKAGSSEFISLVFGSLIYFLCVLLQKMKKRHYFLVKKLLLN